MANITALNIGGQNYEIYATSAASAETLTNTEILVSSATSASKAVSASAADKLKTANNIAASGDVTWSVSFDGSQAKTGAATINNVASAISWSGVSAAVNDAIGDKIGGVYKVMGDSTWGNLTATSAQVNGNVYNITGTVPANAQDRNGNKIAAGDNVVYVTAGTAGWDKLAATLDTSTFVKTTDATYTATTARAKSWADTSANLIASANSGAAASAWITANSGAYISSSHLSNIQTASGYAKDWNDNKTGLTNSAKSGWSALSSISANSAKWVSGEANQNAYAKVSVFTAAGKAVSASASSTQDTFAFSAWGSNIALTATSDANGNPVIGISGKDTNTTYSQGTGITISNNQISVTNYNSIVGSANSGMSALNIITAKSADWAKDNNTKYSLSGWNGVTASYTSDGSTTALKVSGVPATSAAVGVTKASYVSSNVAYIF